MDQCSVRHDMQLVGIHKPCGQERREGGFRKNHVCPHGGERVRQKRFAATRFLHVNSKKTARISKIVVYYGVWDHS